ncbi:MAG: hypothetical protein ACQZ3N_04345 [cyanobacterium endosymbiont of Rhopalodia yunnanensis]
MTQIEPILGTPIFQKALSQVQTFWGMSRAGVFVEIFLGIGLWAIQQLYYH